MCSFPARGMLHLSHSLYSPALRVSLVSSCPVLADSIVPASSQLFLDFAGFRRRVLLVSFLSTRRSSLLRAAASMHRAAAVAQREHLQCGHSLASSRCWQLQLRIHSVFSKVRSVAVARELGRSMKHGSIDVLPMRRSFTRMADFCTRAVREVGSSSENESRSHLGEPGEVSPAANFHRHTAEGDRAQEHKHIIAELSNMHEARSVSSMQEQEEATLRSLEIDSIAGTAVASTSGIDTSSVAAPVAAPPNLENDAESVGGISAREGNVDDVVNRSKNHSERRRKAGLLTRHMHGEVPDLLTVPGIGPRNMEKLVAKGIGKVAELKQLYRNKFLNDETSKMVEYLRSSVGIVHKNHAESITTFVKCSVDEELEEQLKLDKDSNARQKKKVTICVEGNISVGKTTFLQKIANERIELRDFVEIVPEPVGKWKDVGPDHFNLLDAFYNEPERYAYTFQNYVFATRLVQEQQTANGLKPLRLMERSIFTDRLVFVRAIHEAKWMSELELRIYESWFDPFISALPGLVPDGFIYLRASPDTCLQRLHMRNRPEEQTVTLDYLRELHEKHEQCFFPAESTDGVLSVSQWPDGPHKLPPPPGIKDHMFYLQGDHLHSSIQKVPALVLDCEATIDFNRDFEARAEYAQQVAEFYEYIQSTKDFEMEKRAQNGMISPLLLPHAGLLKPDGSSILQDHALNPFNLTRHSSAFMR